MGQSPAHAPFRILLVEDEPVIRELVRSMLTDRDVQVACADTGLSGLKLARTERFDLILLDVVLPEMDGITVCRMLKNEPHTASVPLYMLTARARKTDIDAAMRAGANGYIPKPFRSQELMDLVARIREARPGTA